MMPTAPAARAASPAPSTTLPPSVAALLAELRSPVGVFDAGIGSFALVQHIAQHYPQQDIIYLADRASFPYGARNAHSLAQCVGAAIAQLARWGAAVVVLASNAPTIMVLEGLRMSSPVPVLGVYPPVRQALSHSHSGVVAVLGVRSLVESAALADYIAQEVRAHATPATVHAANASALVDLVESGTFLTQPAATQALVDAFMRELLAAHAGLDVCTLSSTHLPWLRPFFEQAAPQVRFLDPAQDVVDALPALLPASVPLTQAQGAGGRIVCIATESAAHPLPELQATLGRLGVKLPIHRVSALAAP